MFNLTFEGTLREIKTRKILKWLTIYLSTGLTMLGAVNLFASRYDIPGSVFDTLVIFLIFGIVITVIAAWRHGKTGFRGWKKGEIAVYILIIGLAFITAFSFRSDKVYHVEYKSRSIAVLPFNNLSDNKEDNFFSDGITEDILIQLCKISDLKVISKSSVQKYKDTKMSVPEIGKELGVETILSGSIRRAGNRIRISGELIDSKSDQNIWAENYDRDITDIFTIQSEVAQKIAYALRVKLTSAEKQRIEMKSTSNIDAYTLYLKGREYYSHYTNNDNELAINMFKKALSIDPNYALAYSGLSDAYSQRFQRFGYAPAWVDSSLVMAQIAIRLNPDVAEPYKALGLYYFMKGQQKQASQYYLKAVELNPNYAPAISNLGSIYWWTGQYNKALPWLEKNIALNPTRAAAYNSLGLVHLGLANLSHAEKLFKTAIDLQPDYTPAIGNLIKLYLIQDKIAAAKSTALSYYHSFPGDNEILSAAGDTYLFSGNADSALFFYKKLGSSVDLGCILILAKKETEGRRMLDSLIKDNLNKVNSTEEFTPSYDLARMYSVLGKIDESAKWFERAVNSGWLFYIWSSKDPLMKNVKDNPGFINQINRARSQVEAMKN